MTQPDAYGPRELAKDLQQLLVQPAEAQSEQGAWYERALEVQRRVQTSAELPSIPHSLHHFFSDADVRARDARVRDLQFEQVRRHISVLETGVIPPDDSRAVSLGQLLRSLWSFIRAKGR